MPEVCEGKHGKIEDNEHGGRTTTVHQVLKGVQVIDGDINVVGRDLHYHVHHHDANDTTASALKQIPNFRKIHIATLGKVTPGTGTWILESPKFSLWVDPEGYLRLMWGSGMPGAGKTILASIVINALEGYARASELPICVAYVYIRYSDHSKATVRGFLEILVKQTVERHPRCLSLFDEVYAPHIREETQPLEEELFCLLREFTKCMAATFYVLDALDEAPTHIRLLLVEKLASLDVKLFVTSRPLETVQKHFPRAHCFAIIAQDRDLDLHILKAINRSLELRNIVGPAAIWHHQIISSVKQRCKGMFLHASLQLDALRECMSIRDIQETLEAFPPQLENVYLRTWDRIINQTPRKVVLAKKVLLWVLHATRSMTVDELQHAVATCPDTHIYDRTRLVPHATLLALCQGLLTIEEDSRLVRLVHYTAKDVVERLVLESFPHPHSVLAAVCTAHLGSCGFQSTKLDSGLALEAVLIRDAFLSYAYSSWSAHGHEALEEGADMSRILGDFVQGCQAFPVLLHGGTSFEILRPLHVVAYFGLPVTLAGTTISETPNILTLYDALTPLCVASLQRSQDTAEEILRLPHVLVNKAGQDGQTPLIWASRRGRDGVLKLLLSHPHTDVNQVDVEGWSALTWAAHKGEDGAVRILLTHGETNVNQTDNEGNTAVMHASYRGHNLVVTLLLACSHIDLSVTNKKGDTALHAAAKGGHMSTLEALLNHPDTRVNQANKGGWTILLRAAHQGQSDIAKAILAHPKVDVNQADKGGWTPLLRASYYGEEDTVKLLLAHHDTDVNQSEHQQRTPLILASEGGYDGTVKLLLAHPLADINKAGKHKSTALIKAVRMGHGGVVKLLLAHPQVDPNLKGEEGQAALIWAARTGNRDIVKRLLIHPQTDPYTLDRGGLTPLMWASRNGHEGVVGLLLLDPRISVNMTDHQGWTALIWASYFGCKGVVQHLLTHPQIDANVRDQDGETGLTKALANGHRSTVKLLFAYSATHED